MIRKSIVRQLFTWLALALLAGSLLVVLIKTNTDKNVHLLLAENQRLLKELQVEEDLKRLTVDLQRLDQRVANSLNNNDVSSLKNLAGQFSQIEADLQRIKAALPRNKSTEELAILDDLVHQKLDYNSTLADTLAANEPSNERLRAASSRNRQLTDSINALSESIAAKRNSGFTQLSARLNRQVANLQRTDALLMVLLIIGALATVVITIVSLRRQQSMLFKLRKSEAEAQQAVAIKENFLANMSHEIRTPLNAITGFSALLEGERDEARIQEYATTLQHSANHLLRVVNDILDFSKLEAGMMRIEQAAFDPRLLMEQSRQLFASQAAEKEISLLTYVSPTIPHCMVGDAHRLQQLLVNLVGNALKFTHRGMIRAEMLVAHPERGRPSQWKLVVTDTGIGIDQSQQQRIFQRFQQADGTSVRRYGGTGLGLSIVQEIVQLMQGQLQLVSEPGVGSSFQIYLPLLEAVDQLNDPNQNHHMHTTQDYGRTTLLKESLAPPLVLVAEDNTANQLLIARLLERWQLPFLMAANGEEAVALAANHPVSLILMDVQMPVMDGYTAARLISQAADRPLPIIAMTAHHREADRLQASQAGMDAFITKPINIKELENVIRRHLPRASAALAQGLPAGVGQRKLVNFRYLKEVSDGDADYERTMAHHFVQQAPAEWMAIKDSFARRDHASLQKQVHHFKSTLMTWGLAERWEILLETMLADNYASAAALKKVDEEFQIALAQIKRFMEQLKPVPTA